jgi:hypothetical protein
MLQSIEGIYRDGIIELLEKPETKTPVRVIVTFMNENQNADQTVGLDLRERGISIEEAAQQRSVLTSFAEDWERPEMEVYDKL